MKDIDTIVLKAADQNSPVAVRHEAFGELVIRFQDMAFGCAFAVLGDAYLAQDIAQEATLHGVGHGARQPSVSN